MDYINPNEIYHFEEPVGTEIFEFKPLNKNKYYASIAKKMKRIILQKSCTIHPEIDCAICLLSMYNKRVLYTPCGHTFHLNCIKIMINTPTASFTKYNCPLCRTSMIESLKKIGYNTPTNIDIYNGAEELFEEERISFQETVNAVLNIIANSFSPRCFRTMIRDYPTICYDTACICPFCNAAFIQYLHHSQTINNDVYEVINEYINEHNSIIELIVDILRIISFVEADDYIRCIFPNYILS